MRKLIAILFLCASSALALPVSIVDFLYAADGVTGANGTLLIQWPTFVAANGHLIQASSLTYTVVAGVVNLSLESTIDTTPKCRGGTVGCSVYSVTYSIVGQTPRNKEYWSVPTGGPYSITSLRVLNPGPNGPFVPIVSINNFTFSGASGISASAYNFTALSPAGTLTAATPATVTLTPVPLGVNGSDTFHYLYIPTCSGGAQKVLITGGAAVSGSASGTITFTPTNSCTAGWTLTSASSGIQEASSSVSGSGTILLSTGALAIHAITVLPTTISLKGQGGSVTSSTNTVLNCDAAADPCLVVAGNSGLASGNGIGVHSSYTLHGISGTSAGLFLGGDPSSVFAPAAWVGSFTRFEDIDVRNFSNALTLQNSLFNSFVNCIFNGNTRALLIPSNAQGIQPTDFFGGLLSVPSGAAVEMNQNCSLACPVQYFGGQISGTITGSAVDWDSSGTHYEPNSADTPVVSITAASGNRVRISGGLMSIHPSAPGSMPNGAVIMNGAGYYMLNMKDVWFQDDFAISQIVTFGTSIGGSLVMQNIEGGSAPGFTNLYALTTSPIFQISITQASIANTQPTVAAAASVAFPQMNHPIAQALTITGGTVGGSGITAVSGLLLRQSGILNTSSAQTFTAGATIGNTFTTVASIPVTYYFDGTKIWLK